ncbi:MAG: 3-dehydroquinate synthase, partial [Clostridia bacterium]|nr:3-dehydroquinate synthase [Clostridia bacterium]
LAMLEQGFGRGDCVVAVGGGVVGDLAGFVAASFMRGVDFYNIPTTLLSQVDSSVGGKTAINLGHIKNIVGAFHQPKKVLIDTDTLKTLPPRQIASGMAEVIKMSLTSDPELFSMLEGGEGNFATLIARALQIKISVVEQDEKESGLRKILNFGHTIGHGIESVGGGRFYHGECVAMGMLPLCAGGVKERLLPVLRRYGLPTGCSMDAEKVYAALLHDKKAQAGKVTVVKVPAPGSFALETVDPETLRPGIRELTGN